jgi:rare lipoprotein A
MNRKLLFLFIMFINLGAGLAAQPNAPTAKNPTVLYGTASYYAEKFKGRETANGETFDQGLMTAACNVLPLGTWIRVTNLNNGRFIIVKVNDRLHPRMKRVIDLSKSAAKKLKYTGEGLAKVKVEPLGKQKPLAVK